MMSDRLDEAALEHEINFGSPTTRGAYALDPGYAARQQRRVADLVTYAKRLPFRRWKLVRQWRGADHHSFEVMYDDGRRPPPDAFAIPLQRWPGSCGAGVTVRATDRDDTDVVEMSFADRGAWWRGRALWTDLAVLAGLCALTAASCAAAGLAGGI